MLERMLLSRAFAKEESSGYLRSPGQANSGFCSIPACCHCARRPKRRWEKFDQRNHDFIPWGLPPDLMRAAVLGNHNVTPTEGHGATKAASDVFPGQLRCGLVNSRSGRFPQIAQMEITVRCGTRGLLHVGVTIVIA